MAAPSVEPAPNGGEPRPAVAVLVACYNRAPITLPNLGRLIAALDGWQADYRIFLLDDASPDGTGDQVRQAYPQVTVIQGTGSLFWNRGMRVLHQAARREGPWTAYLLYNDDVSVGAVQVAAFGRLWEQLNRERPTTLAGATRSPARDATTYAAYRRRSPLRPFAIDLVPPGTEPLPVDTFNGNFVLMPAETLDQVGGFDPAYVHQFGDLDLGYRIGRRGDRVMLAPGHIGWCEDRPGSSRSRHGLLRRMRMGLSGRETPTQHIHFTWKNSSSRVVAVPVILAMLAKRLWVLAANKPHVYPGSTDALE